MTAMGNHPQWTSGASDECVAKRAFDLRALKPLFHDAGVNLNVNHRNCAISLMVRIDSGGTAESETRGELSESRNCGSVHYSFGPMWTVK